MGYLIFIILIIHSYNEYKEKKFLEEKYKEIQFKLKEYERNNSNNIVGS